MRIIHTFDMRLDAPCTDAPYPEAFGDARRAERRHVFTEIVDDARSWNADALCIAGNLFMGDRLSRESRTFLHQAFESLGGIPVIIAPGEFDRPGSLSPYSLHVWPGNVLCFDTPEWSQVELSNGVRAIGRAYGGEPAPPEWDSALGDGKDSIACCYAPWRPDAFNHTFRSCAYAALGGAPASMLFSARHVRSAPAAIAHGFATQDTGAYLRIEIGQEKIDVEERYTSGRTFHTVSLNAGDETNQDDVTVEARQRLQELPADACVRFILTGNGTSNACAGALREMSAPHTAFVHIVDERVPTIAERAREVGGVSAAITDKLLAEWSDTADDARRRMLARAHQLALTALQGQDLPSVSELGSATAGGR